MTISDQELAEARNISIEQVQLLRMSRGTTNDTLLELPQAYLRRALLRASYPDLPTARAEFRLRQALGDDRALPPPHAVGRARAQAQALTESEERPSTTAGVPTGAGGAAAGPPAPAAGGPAPTAGLSRTGWEWLGPGNIGGRTRGIVVHPGDPHRIWAASAGGGVWHTQDGGQQWAPVDDFLDNLACTCIAMDPTDSSTVYVGTGEGFSNVDAIRGNGLFRTTDGTVWAPIAATQVPDFRAVTRIAVSADGAVLLAAGPAGIFRSGDPARAQWESVLEAEVGDVRFDPSDPQVAVAGALGAGEAWFSRDGGATWTPSTHDAWDGRVELAHAAADPAIVYASVEMRGDPVHNGQIWRSEDGGRTYLPRATKAPNGRPAPYLGDQGWYSNAIWAGDPTDGDLLVTGGVNLWRSTDGGAKLAEISTWQTNVPHADHHALVSHPGYDGVTNRTIFVGNDGGVFAGDLARTGSEPKPPFAKGWTELVNNYGVTQFYAGAGNSTTGTIVGGAQDNGSIGVTAAGGPQGWRQFFGGDGGWVAADPTDPKTFYGEYVFLNIHRNTDGVSSDDTEGDRYISGQFFNPALVTPQTPDGAWDWKKPPFRIEDARGATTGATRTALFIAPFVLDPNDPNRLFAGGLSLWRTDNAKAPNTFTSGPSWRAVKPGNGPTSLISALAVTPGNSDRVWVGHEDGPVFRSTDATSAAPTWQRVGTTGPDRLQPQRYCTAITVHPAHPDTVYVCFGGFSSGNLWVTEDAGARWRNLATALPAAPIRALAVHPAHDAFLYCGTEIGLFASDDAGATWSPTNQGPTNCSVDDLFFMKKGGKDVLVCVTHGRGMFRITV